LLEVEKREAKREFTWIEADYHKAKCAQGLHTEKTVTELNQWEVFDSYSKSLYKQEIYK